MRYFSTFDKELNFVSRYHLDLGGQNVIGIEKQIYSILIHTKNRIGFTRVGEKTITNNFCESVHFIK
jgi:hypothetical protein